MSVPPSWGGRLRKQPDTWRVRKHTWARLLSFQAPSKDPAQDLAGAHCTRPPPATDSKAIKTHTGPVQSTSTPKARTGNWALVQPGERRGSGQQHSCLEQGVPQASPGWGRLSQHLSFTHRFYPGHWARDLLQNRPVHQPVLVLLPEHWRLPPGHPGSRHAHLEHSSQERGLHGAPSDCHQPLLDGSVSPWARQ